MTSPKTPEQTEIRRRELQKLARSRTLTNAELTEIENLGPETSIDSIIENAYRKFPSRKLSTLRKRYS